MKLDKALTYGPSRDGGITITIYEGHAKKGEFPAMSLDTGSIHLPPDQVEELIEALFMGDMTGSFYGN